MGIGAGTLNPHPNEGKRRWARNKVNAPVRVLVEGLNDTLVIDGRCIKMSEGGMCFFAVANLVIGAQISLEFVSPSSSKSGRVRGTIRNQAVYLYGVEYEVAGGVA